MSESLHAELLSLRHQLDALIAKVAASPASSPVSVSVEAVAQEVAQFSGVPYADILGKAKPQRVVDARWTAYFFCYAFTGESGTQIAKTLNRADHTTFYNGVGGLIDRWKYDGEFRSRHQRYQDHLSRVFGFIPCEPPPIGPVIRFRRVV